MIMQPSDANPGVAGGFLSPWIRNKERPKLSPDVCFRMMVIGPLELLCPEI
jgi:hypothetical protein